MSMETSALQLLRTCADSSETEAWRAFEALFRPRLAAGVTRALWRSGQTPHHDLVAELIQETYCRLLAHDRLVLRSFRGSTDGEAFAYLIRVAESVTIDRLRNRSAAKRGADLLVDDTEQLTRDARDPRVSPETSLLRRDLWRLFWQRCGALIGSRDKRRDLAILELALFQGWSSREIAASHGLPPSTVDTILYRVRQRLARRGIRLPNRDGALPEGDAQEVAEGDAPDVWSG